MRYSTFLQETGRLSIVGSNPTLVKGHLLIVWPKTFMTLTNLLVDNCLCCTKAHLKWFPSLLSAKRSRNGDLCRGQ